MKNRIPDLHQVVESRRLWYLTDEFSVTQKLLGEGGFSDVFEGCIAESGVKVAVKFLRLREGLSQTKFEKIQQRFEREIALLTKISLDGVLKTLSSKCVVIGRETPGIPDEIREKYALAGVFEFVDGVPLTEWKPGSVSDLTQFFLDLVEIISRLHENQVLHRDLKLSNVFITKKGKPMVMDFGMAAGKFELERFTSVNEFHSSEGYRPLPPLHQMTEVEDIRRIGEMMEKLAGDREGMSPVRAIASKINDGEIASASELARSLRRNIKANSKSRFLIFVTVCSLLLALSLALFMLLNNDLFRIGKTQSTPNQIQSSFKLMPGFDPTDALTLTKLGYPTAYHNGCQLVKDGKLNEARLEFEKLQVAIPCYWQMGLAFICDTKSDFAGAIKHYEIAIKHDVPAVAEWTLNYGFQSCHKKLGKLDESDAFAKKLLNLTPIQAVHHRYRFNCYVLLGDKQKAVNEAKIGIQMDQAYTGYFKNRFEDLEWDFDGVE